MAALSVSSHPQAGFTLLETLVVIVIIATLTTLTVFSLSGDPERQLRTQADHISQLLQAGADDAVYRHEPIGFYVTPPHYGFLRYDITANKWRPINDGIFRSNALPDKLHMEMMLAGEAKSFFFQNTAERRPAIIFFPSGEITPFRILLSMPPLASTQVIATDGIAPITVQEQPQ